MHAAQCSAGPTRSTIRTRKVIMKFVIILCLVAALGVAHSAEEEQGTRNTRSTSFQHYPPHVETKEQIRDWVAQEDKKRPYCHTYVFQTGGVEWQSCPKEVCGEGLVKKPEDLSKKYPGCCGKCEVAIS